MGVWDVGKRSYNGVLNQIMEKIMEYNGHIYFVTLTMRDDNVLNKDSISNFFRKMEYRGVNIEGYVWVKELQKRGVVHFHMIVLVPEKMRDFYNVVSDSWKHGFVFVKGVEKGKIRNTILYIMKYIKKELNDKAKNDKMKRKLGRGGILRFRTETFVSRVVRFSEFEYVGSGSTKGMKVKFYRCGDMVMFVASGINGVSIDIFEWDIEKSIEKFKYEMKNSNKIASLLNNVHFLGLNRVEREDILGYHKFDRDINKLLWQLHI